MQTAALTACGPVNISTGRSAAVYPASSRMFRSPRSVFASRGTFTGLYTTFTWWTVTIPVLTLLTWGTICVCLRYWLWNYDSCAVAVVAWCINFSVDIWKQETEAANYKIQLCRSNWGTHHSFWVFWYTHTQGRPQCRHGVRTPKLFSPSLGTIYGFMVDQLPLPR